MDSTRWTNACSKLAIKASEMWDVLGLANEDIKNVVLVTVFVVFEKALHFILLFWF